MKDTIFSALKSGVKPLLIGFRNDLMNIYSPTLQHIEWAKHQIFCIPDVKNLLTLCVILPLASTGSETATVTESGSKETFFKPGTPF